MAIRTWMPYALDNGNTVKDPMAALILGGNNPNPSGGRWSYNQDSDTWTQQVEDPKPASPAYNQTSYPSLAAASQPAGFGGGGVGSLKLGGSGGQYEDQLLSQIMTTLKNKPTHTGGNLKPYQVQDMSYEDALARTGPGYQMKGDEELSKRAQLMADLAVNPQRKEAERQQQAADLQHHNDMRRAELMYAGKDQVAQDLANKMAKQNAVDQAARGGQARSGLADYQQAKVNEAVGQQLSMIELNKQESMYEIESRYGLASEQISAALSDLEERRGMLSVEAFQSLSDREQEIYLQQENAKSQIALNLMNQFMAGEQMKLQASLAEIESADKRFANELQAWLGGLNASLSAYEALVDTGIKKDTLKLQGKQQELAYLQSMLPYTNMTVADEAKFDLAWAELMGERPRR